MFDRWSYFGDKRRRLMEQSWAGVFRNHLLVELPVDDLCRHLDERMGRPSKDLHVVIGVLLLQQLHDLSDAETVEALAFNMAWRRCHVNHRVTSLWAPTPEIMQRSSLAATVSSRRRGIGGVFGGRPDGVGR